MGKGTIVGGGTDGLYSVQLNFSRLRITRRIAALQAQVETLTTQIDAVESEISTLDWDILTLKSEILLLELDKVANATQIKEKNNLITKKIEERYQKQLKKSALDLTKTGCQKKVTYLQTAMPADEVVSAWCADLTEDLAGEVGTIEIPGERGTVLIRPGSLNGAIGGAAYSGSQDGVLEPAIAGTPAGTFFNWALLPGWQKWKPTYRKGTITAIDGDLCDLELDAALSSAQGLDVNAYDQFANVPIEYMT